MSVSHLEWTIFLLSFGGGNICYMYIIDFIKKKKKYLYLYRFSAYWLRSSVARFATLDQILAEFKPSVILREISFCLLKKKRKCLMLMLPENVHIKKVETLQVKMLTEGSTTKAY